MRSVKILAPLTALLLTACSARQSPIIQEEGSSQTIDIQTKESAANYTDRDNSEGMTSSAAEPKISSYTSDPAESESKPDTLHSGASSPSDTPLNIRTGLIREQILHGAEGDIHYSYFLPKSYDGSRKYPMMGALFIPLI